MTTGGIVKGKKSGKIEIPPEIEDLFKGGKQPDWNIPGYDFLPDELSPQSFFAMMRELDPYELYLWQLRDYLSSLILPQRKMEGTEFATEEKPLLTLEQAQKILDEAELAIELGQPVETMPFYEEASKTLGENVRRAYEEELTTFVQEEEEEARELEKTRKSLLDKYTPQSAEDRLKLLRGVEEGTVTWEEAYGGTKGKQKPYPWAPNTEDLDKAAFEMQQAGVSSDEIRRWMTEIAPQIKAGNIEQEMDTRSPWVKWQHAMADEENARLVGQMDKETIAKYQPFLRELAQYGIPVDEGVINTLTMSERYSEDPSWGLARNVLQDRLNEAKRQELIGKGTWYKQMAPELFGEFRKAQPVLSTGTPANYYEAQFPGWLETEPNKQRKLDFETKLSRDYGDVLPEYQNYLERNRFQGVKPINAWIQENPEISTYWQKRQAQRMKGLASRGSEF